MRSIKSSKVLLFSAFVVATVSTTTTTSAFEWLGIKPRVVKSVPTEEEVVAKMKSAMAGVEEEEEAVKFRRMQAFVAEEMEAEQLKYRRCTLGKLAKRGSIVNDNGESYNPSWSEGCDRASIEEHKKQRLQLFKDCMQDPRSISRGECAKWEKIKNQYKPSWN